MSKLNLAHDALAKFDPDAEKSHTLPGYYYYDRDIYEREKLAIFYHNWLYAGHVCLLDAPGKYLVRDIGDQSVIIIRHKDGELRGFHNVCQHRAHRLLEGEGGVRANIMCPYHNWTYEISGELKHARGSDRMLHFDRGGICLQKVNVEVFCGFVFYNFDLDATPMSIQFTALREEILAYSPHAPTLKRGYRREYPVKANWKNTVENFDECYHCPNQHRVLMDGGLDIETYRITVSENHHTHYSRDRGTNQAYTHNPDVDGRGKEFGGWLLWPNLSLEVYPGGYLNVFYHHPLDVEETVQIVEWYFDTETVTPEQQSIIDFMHITRAEDIPICESVQRGLHSMGYGQGRFVVDPERSSFSEHAVHDFQSRVVHALGDKS